MADVFLCFALLSWAESSTSLGNSVDSAGTDVEGVGVAGPEFSVLMTSVSAEG